MAKFIVECVDERGDRMEAHFEYRVGEPSNRFHVEVISEKGLRGQFVLDVPVGVTLGAALEKRVQDGNIHAHN